MELSLYRQEVFEKYKSASQQMRVLTESWAAENLFCPSCLQPRVSAYPNNHPVADFFCQKCSQQYQLKSQKTNFGKKINDGAFGKMIESIRSLNRPNFLFMKYDTDYSVEDLMVVPSFFFTEEIVEKRKPLNSSAKRKGWIGCNLLIHKLPPEGKIAIVEDEKEVPKRIVNDQWKKIRFLAEKPLQERGWLIDVLNVVHSLEQKEFALQDVYAFEPEFSKKHPDNRHIKDKIRQQLQFLRDKRILKFKGNGHYSLI